MNTSYNYNNYVKKLSKRYSNLLEGISFVHNFDTGVEFEIAICEALQAILPNKYGVCRGFVVTRNGEKAGDDIIIYDKYRFPRLRADNEQSFARKEQIPVEAVYAYIEAKNSLIMTGKKGNLFKAVSQAQKVKELVSQRDVIDARRSIDPYHNLTFLNDGSEDRNQRGWPEIFNPFFTAIFAKEVREKESAKKLNGKEVGAILDLIGITNFETDLIIAGDDLVVLPFLPHPGKTTGTYSSPFFITGKSVPRWAVRKGLAFSIGICSLLYAIDTIRLGAMPWPYIIGDALSIPVTKP